MEAVGGQGKRKMAGGSHSCQCEERGDEAISIRGVGDCLASLAMTYGAVLSNDGVCLGHSQLGLADGGRGAIMKPPWVRRRIGRADHPIFVEKAERIPVFESLTEKFNSVFRSLSGRGRITEANVPEAMREVRTALLEADVNYKVVKQFCEDVREKADRRRGHQEPAPRPGDGQDRPRRAGPADGAGGHADLLRLARRRRSS